MRFLLPRHGGGGVSHLRHENREHHSSCGEECADGVRGRQSRKIQGESDFFYES